MRDFLIKRFKNTFCFESLDGKGRKQIKIILSKVRRKLAKNEERIEFFVENLIIFEDLRRKN